MLRKTLIGGLLLAVVIAFAATTPHTEETNTDKDQVLIDLIVNGISANHYEETPIDNDFSERVYTLYLKNMDYSKRFFLKEDVETLSLYKHKLDDQVRDRNLEFMDLTVDIYKKRLKQIEAYTKDILSKPFNFEKIENIEVDPEKRDFATDEKQHKEYWRRYLKYQVLTRVASRMDEMEKAQNDGNEDVEIITLAEVEAEVREKVLKTHEDWFHRLDRQEREEYRNIYLNAFASAFDPHTNYFPPKDKENFDISMSGKLEGIGAQLREEGSYIKVTSIVPGSPSWKQGELKAGDIILKVAQGDEEPEDIVDVSIDDAVKLIRGPKGTEVNLTVKKIDGTISVISIIRDVVILEETYAKSAIIKKEGLGHKVGYISLPKFYADFSNTGGRNSGDDVKKEVLKLKEDGIDGLVIDLRNNGGGSLQDVVEMAGLFIETGPIVQVKPRGGAPYMLEDRDPTIVYDGPLVILVNEFSASASEILAAAMQDYGRAIVIGSKNTFGKGTVQRFFDLDDFVTPDLNDLKPLGVIKLTTQKFYRVNGQTTQLNGVASDIVLPDAYAYMELGEKEEDYPLQWDVIDPARYTVWNNNLSNFREVENNSNKRVKSNELFGLMMENAVRLDEQSDDSEYSLHLGIYQEEMKKRERESKKYEDIEREQEDITVTTLKSDKPAIDADESKQERTKEWHKNIRKDIYINEALLVVKDMIELPKHPVTDNNK